MFIKVLVRPVSEDAIRSRDTKEALAPGRVREMCVHHRAVGIGLVGWGLELRE